MTIKIKRKKWVTGVQDIWECRVIIEKLYQIIWSKTVVNIIDEGRNNTQYTTKHKDKTNHDEKE